MLSLEKRQILLSGIVGQSNIVKEFIKRTTNKIDIPQTILLSGSSGSGKTTLAYIIAKILNCKNPIKNKDGYLEPCNECPSCKDILTEKFSRDVKFIDCSSYNKENVVDLQKESNIMSIYDKNKIFILDEFQELGSKAKSAVLKLLEKPRKNVYFICCTMDIKSIDKSVIDRCQHYKFKSIDYSEISEYLFNIISDMENIPESFFSEGLHTIAYNAQGSIRNALSNLERCIFSELWTKEVIEKELGFLSENRINEILLSLLKKEKNALHDLNSLNNLDEFFYKTRKILIDSKIYKITGSLEEEWKIKQANLYSQYNLDDLLRIYVESLNSYGYFDNNRFIYNLLINYYKNENIIQESTTKRRVISES